MRRTIITLNRFTIFIPSSLGKKISGLLGICLFAFIIISCKDEASLIGFQKDPRLNGTFIDIPLKVSVIQNPNLLTDNPAGETVNRILVGQYNDPLFGKMEARGYASLAEPPLYSKPSSAATFDSLVLQLNFDYYYAGLPTVSQQKIQIFEVLDTINYNKAYTASTNVAIGTTPLAEKTFTVSGEGFDNALSLLLDSDTTNDAKFNVRFRMPAGYGQNLLNDFKAVKRDSTFKTFSGKYKGFAFIMPDGQGDKILGINPVFRSGNPMVTDTKMSLYYTDNGTQSKFDFVLYQNANPTSGQFNAALSYSKITTNRSATALAGITTLTDFQPTDGRYYVQSGTSLITKIELTNFYNFIDTINAIAFNQAELIIKNISPNKPPAALSLRVLDSLNRFRSSLLDTITNQKATTTPDPFFIKTAGGFSAPTSGINTTASVLSDLYLDIPIATDTYVIGNIYLTSLCQSLHKYKTDKRRPKAIGVTVAGDSFRKSVSGVILDKDISLRIYYSKPVIKIR